jgi:hypothetical protein
LLSLALGVGIVMLWPAPSRPSSATFKKVRQGWTRENVVTVVGAQPDEVRSNTNGGVVTESFAVWRGSDADFHVRFGPDGRVEVAECRMKPRPGPWRQLRNWLGL